MSGLAASAIGGAGAGAVSSAILGGNVGLGALAGFAGGSISYAGGRVWGLGADAVAGGVAAEIQGGNFGEGAAQGAYYNMAATVGGLLAPTEGFSPENTNEGDIVYLKADSPVGVGISLFDGGLFSHVGTVVRDASGNLALASTNFGKNNGYIPLEDYRGRGAHVSTRFRGNQAVVNAARALAAQQSPQIQYGFLPGQKVCSTITASVLNSAGYKGWYGIGPNSQSGILGYQQFRLTRTYGY